MIRVLVAIAIIVPLMIATGFRNPWYVTFGIAMLGFGAGHLVEAMVNKGKDEQVPPKE